DENNEFVGTAYNDVFAFYINGENCAVVGTGAGAVPVTTNTINNNVNSAIYNDNALEPAPFDTELDGFTDPLVCAGTVKANEVNHIKLAIADTSDDTRDSTVLIQAGTFKANHAPVASDGAFTTTPGTAVGTPLVATDPDGDELSYAVVDESAAGTISGTGKDLTFTPAEGFVGTTSFTFRANDGALDSNVATV